jgi:hypothetical protein
MWKEMFALNLAGQTFVWVDWRRYEYLNQDIRSPDKDYELESLEYEAAVMTGMFRYRPIN